MTKDSRLPAQISGGSRSLVGPAVAIAVVVGGLFAFTHSVIFASLAAVLGALAVFTRQLVRKSLAATANSESALQLGSVDGQLTEMKKKVSKAKFFEFLEADGERLARQAELLIQQRLAIKKVLAQKFEPTELTHSRYLEGLDNNSLAISENLQFAESILQNLNLSAKTQLDPASRPSEWTAEQNRAQQLMALIDQSLQQLTQLYQSLNEITTKDHHRNDLEESMRQIKELADRAKNYSAK